MPRPLKALISPRALSLLTMLQLSRRAPAIFAATLALLSFTHAPLGHAAQIDVILGGASVIGTECVNGKVVEGASMAVGPNQTLYVKTAASTKLRRNVLGAAWGQDDKIKFKDLVVNSVLQQVQPIFNYGNGKDETALFGRAGEAEFSIPQGQGRYQMLYTSGNAATDLGTMYTAESVYVDGGWGDYYSCEPPLPESPGRPVIEEVVAGIKARWFTLMSPLGRAVLLSNINIQCAPAKIPENARLKKDLSPRAMARRRFW